MSSKIFLILGGYGSVGQSLARLLLQETDTRLVLAGRTIKKAVAAAEQLNAVFEGKRVVGMYADASDVVSLRRAFKGVDFVVVASSTVRYTKEVATMALEAGIDYLDIQYSSGKIVVLKSLSREIEKAGRCFITDGGFHPGLPAALVRYVGQHFDCLERAKVGSVIKYDFTGLSTADATVYEFLEEISGFQSLVFKEGQWKKARMLGVMDCISMDFGREFGKQYCVPVFLEEMRSIPEMYPSLREVGFFAGGFNWFVDWLVLPLAIIALRISPKRAVRPMGQLAKWGLNTFSSDPPHGTVLKVEAHGEKDGRVKMVEVALYHEDAYMFTAIPVAACLLQYLDGSITKPGLWTQANVVEPDRLIRDMERMGIDVQIREEMDNYI